MGVADEADAIALHELGATQHHPVLVELHVRDAVHQQAARAVLAFEHGDRMPRAIELLRCREPGGPGSHHGDALAGTHLWWIGNHPAFFPAPLDDRRFERLDRDRRITETEHAGALTGRGTDAASEIREVVRAVQALERLAPQAAIDEIIPLGNEVVHRAARGTAAHLHARVAERHAAVHAARSLLPQVLLLHVMVEFVPVPNAILRRAIDRQLAQILHETRWLAHLDTARISCRRRVRGRGRFPRRPPSRPRRP